MPIITGTAGIGAGVGSSGAPAAAGASSLFSGLAVGGAVLGAFSIYAQFQASKRQAKFQAAIAAQNAELARLQQLRIERESAKTTKRQVLDTQKFIADQLTLYAASGVDVSSTTVKEIISDSARTGSADVVQSMNTSAEQAWNAKTESRIGAAKANLFERQAKSLKGLSYVAVVSSLLNSAGSFAGGK